MMQLTETDQPSGGARSALRRYRRLGALSLWALLAPIMGGTVLLASAGVVAPWLRAHGIVAAVLLAVFAALAGSVAAVPTYALSLVAGWAFGAAGGLAVAWAGLTVAAALAYGIARRLGSGPAEELLARHPRAAAARQALVGSTQRRAAWIVLLLRLPPVFPFSMVNLLTAVAGTPWRAFLVGTVVGLIPRTAAVAYLGSTLSQLRLDQPRDFTSAVLSIAITLAVVLIISHMARSALQRLGAAPSPCPAAPIPASP